MSEENKELSEILRPPLHEQRANRFMEAARDLIEKRYPDLKIILTNFTEAEFELGDKIRDAVKTDWKKIKEAHPEEWKKWEEEKKKHSPRQRNLEKMVEQNVIKAGEEADVEGASQTRINCNLFGDSDEKLAEAHGKIIKISRALQGKLLDAELQDNFVRDAYMKMGDATAEDLALFIHSSNYLFR
jgi:hypothetical protein